MGQPYLYLYINLSLPPCHVIEEEKRPCYVDFDAILFQQLSKMVKKGENMVRLIICVGKSYSLQYNWIQYYFCRKLSLALLSTLPIPCLWDVLDHPPPLFPTPPQPLFSIFFYPLTRNNSLKLKKILNLYYDVITCNRF